LSWAADLQTTEEAPEQPASVFTGEKISVEFQNTDIRQVLRIIGEVSGKNVVVSEGVSGRVTLKLVDMPWDQALDAVLASRNLALEESDNVLIIYDQATLQRVQAGRPKPGGERFMK
jgi:Type II secretory pathway, component HofQ